MPVTHSRNKLYLCISRFMLRNKNAMWSYPLVNWDTLAWEFLPKTGKLAEPQRNSGTVIPTKVIQCLTYHTKRFMQQNSLLKALISNLCIMQNNSSRTLDFFFNALKDYFHSALHIFLGKFYVAIHWERSKVAIASSYGRNLPFSNWCWQKNIYIYMQVYEIKLGKKWGINQSHTIQCRREKWRNKMLIQYWEPNQINEWKQNYNKFSSLLK